MLMGGRFDITLVGRDTLLTERYLDTVVAEITRIENLISDWKPTSQVSEVNRQAGMAPVRVDRELFDLTRRAIHFSQITHGAFDISFAAMEKIWKFDGSMTTLPTPEAVRKSVEKVGYKNIILDSIQSTIFLQMPGMKIGFGALGEGYAADRCRDMMLARGITAGIVNASGDIRAWGTQPDGKAWVIGITDPKKTDRLLAILPLYQEGVTTSGSYEKFAIIHGQRYAHIINPVTGYPATGVSSVTVFGPRAEICNGFSTSLMVLGPEAGLKLIDEYPAYSCILVTDKGRVIRSKNLPYKKLCRAKR